MSSRDEITAKLEELDIVPLGAQEMDALAVQLSDGASLSADPNNTPILETFGYDANAKGQTVDLVGNYDQTFTPGLS